MASLSLLTLDTPNINVPLHLLGSEGRKIFFFFVFVFFLKVFGGHMCPFLGVTGTPVLGFLVTSPLDFKE